MGTRKYTAETNSVDPLLSVGILVKLERLGLTNTLFSRIHHRGYDAIKAHTDYCLKTGGFKSDSTNGRLQVRLRYVLDEIERRYAKRTRIDEGTFIALIEEAKQASPF